MSDISYPTGLWVVGTELMQLLLQRRHRIHQSDVVRFKGSDSLNGSGRHSPKSTFPPIDRGDVDFVDAGSLGNTKAARTLQRRADLLSRVCAGTHDGLCVPAFEVDSHGMPHTAVVPGQGFSQRKFSAASVLPVPWYLATWG